MARLEQLGLDIVGRMHRLNLFYSKTIKRFEKSIFLFESTALYSVYLLSTTNFKEYAEMIIKNTAKLLEDVYALESNAAETYSIRTVVRKVSKSYLPKQSTCLSLNNDGNSLHNMLGDDYFRRCKLMIDEVSSGFCKMIGIRRIDLIGSELKSIIPYGYQ